MPDKVGLRNNSAISFFFNNAGELYIEILKCLYQ